MENSQNRCKNHLWSHYQYHTPPKRFQLSLAVPSLLVAYGQQKNSKNNHQTFINNFLTQVATINPTITIFKFFSKDRIPPHIPPCIPTPPLQKPFQLPADHGSLHHYFPGHVPDNPSNITVMLYFGHTAEFTTIASSLAEWLWARNATLVMTPIQSEHATDLCWFVYSTKNTNCINLGATLTHLLGFKVGLQFKTVHTGSPSKPQALAVHLLADEVDTPYHDQVT